MAIPEVTSNVIRVGCTECGGQWKACWPVVFFAWGIVPAVNRSSSSTLKDRIWLGQGLFPVSPE